MPRVGALLATLILILVTSASKASNAYHFSVNEDGLTAPIDQSLLNAPLGASARLIVNGPHFFQVGPDGSPGTLDDLRVRLFGINLSFAANFPSKSQAPLIAKRLRKLGFNAVRLHHLDSLPSHDTNPPRSILTPGPFPSFNEEAVSRLRFFIQVLAQEGLYINLNLHVGYRFQADDGIPSYDPSGMTRPHTTPIKVFEPILIEKQKILAGELIERLGLRQAPNLAMVEISNESSLLAAWHRQEWPDAVPGSYYDLLTAQWHAWLKQRYGTPRAACQHWDSCSGDDWPPLQEARRRVAPSTLAALGQRVNRKLSAWIPSRDGASSLPHTDPIQTDFQHFLADTDHHYFSAIRDFVQQKVGWPVPMTGSQMSYGGFMNFVSHRAMDYLDDHIYIDHPEFMQGSSEPRDWRIWDVSLTGRYMEEMVSNTAYRRDYNKPFVVSEFNHPFPSRQGAEVIPVMAAFASLQDWDGLFFFDYTDFYHEADAPSNFSLRGDWGKYANLGQSARLFRNYQIHALSATHNFTLPDTLIARLSTLDAESSLRTYLQHQTKHVALDAWKKRIGLHASSSRVLKTAQTGQPDVIPSAQYLPSEKRLLITSPHALGWFGTSASPEQVASALDLPLTVQTPESTHASVLLTALDNTPIEKSKRVLISLGSATVGSQPGSIPPRPKKWVRHPAGNSSWTLEPDPNHSPLPSGSRHATGPAWVFWTPTQLRLPWANQALALYPLDPSGLRRPTLPPSRIRQLATGLELSLQQEADEASLWYELVLH